MDTLVFDIESTGPNASKDRIVQLAILVVSEDKEVLLKKSKKYNPGIPITKEATAIHGITDEDVQDCDSFKDDAKKLKKIFENKIIVTYNGLRFDIPMLMAEFERAKVSVELSGKFIDVMKVETKLAPRDLSSVYKKYTGKTLNGAHDALADVMATSTIYDAHYSILWDRVEHADGCGADVSVHNYDFIDELMELSGSKNIVDYSGKLKRDDQGYLIFTFGKNKDHRAIDEKEYCSWILNSDFPTQMKNLIREEISNHTIKKTSPTKETYYPSKGNPLQKILHNKMAENGDLPF
jgi:DNA polymerase-3 subunit epsilon